MYGSLSKLSRRNPVGNYGNSCIQSQVHPESPDLNRPCLVPPPITDCPNGQAYENIQRVLVASHRHQEGTLNVSEATGSIHGRLVGC